jgi:hypothetical protein
MREVDMKVERVEEFAYRPLFTMGAGGKLIGDPGKDKEIVSNCFQPWF